MSFLLPPRSLRSRLALAALSAALYALACPPWDVVPLAFVCWVPLLVASRGASPRAALAVGAVHGGLTSVFFLGWLGTALRTFVAGNGALAAAFTAGVLGLFALRTAPLAWMLARADARGWPRGPALGASLVALELAWSWFIPWMSGYQLHAAPLLAQAADLGGPYLLTFLLGLASAGVEHAFERARARRRIDRRAVVAALAVPAGLAVYGGVAEALSLARERGAPTSRVGIIQRNDPIDLDVSAALAGYRRESEALARAEGERGLDLIVWPESAVGTALNALDVEGSLRARARLAVPGTPPALLVGAILAAPGANRLSNGAALLRGDGTLAGTYGKVHAMPLGEYLPFGEDFPVLYEWLPNAGHVLVSDRARPIDALGHRIQVRVCFEEGLAEATRRAVVDNDPDLLVGLTNDAWFGDTPAWALHRATARMRAIEHHRTYVRAVNNGPSAVIDARGHIVAEAPRGAAATLVGTIRWTRATTAYEIVGDWPARALALFAALACFASARSRASRERASERRPGTETGEVLVSFHDHPIE